MSLCGVPVTTKASSTLKRSAQYSPKNVLDGNDETCWNSDQGSPQWLEFAFSSPVDLSEVIITFQGGFVGQSCSAWTIAASDSTNELKKACGFEPDDVNSEQAFPVSAANVRVLRLVFERSTDFYGRVTVYHVSATGSASPAA